MNEWKELWFSEREILRGEHRIDMLEEGSFDVDEVKINPKWKALLLTGIHRDLDGKERKAELWAYLKADEEELEKVETAGESLQFGWEDYQIDYLEEKEV